MCAGGGAYGECLSLHHPTECGYLLGHLRCRSGPASSWISLGKVPQGELCIQCILGGGIFRSLLCHHLGPEAECDFFFLDEKSFFIPQWN